MTFKHVFARDFGGCSYRHFRTSVSPSQAAILLPGLTRRMSVLQIRARAPRPILKPARPQRQAAPQAQANPLAQARPQRQACASGPGQSSRGLPDLMGGARLRLRGPGRPILKLKPDSAPPGCASSPGQSSSFKPDLSGQAAPQAQASPQVGKSVPNQNGQGRQPLSSKQPNGVLPIRTGTAAHSGKRDPNWWHGNAGFNKERGVRLQLFLRARLRLLQHFAGISGAALAFRRIFALPFSALRGERLPVLRLALAALWRQLDLGQYQRFAGRP